MKTVASEDFHVPVKNVLSAALKDAEKGRYATVAVVGIGMGGEIIVASSVGTPQTLNLLAQGVKLANGDYDEDDEREAA